MKRMAMGIVLALCSCGKAAKDEPANQVKAPLPADAATPVAAAPNPAQTYATHMRDGDALEKQRKWAEALAEFELALAAKPADPTALAEVGFTAYRAGKLDRARAASEAAAVAANEPKLRGMALFNLGLAVEDKLPNAAAALYAASNVARPNGTVRARLAKLERDQPSLVRQPAPDGDALLAKLKVDPIKLPPVRKPSTPLDRALLDALDAAGVEWDSGAGKSVALISDVVCTETTATHAFACTNPPATDQAAKALVDNLIARKIVGKQDGDHVTYRVATVRCRSFDAEGPDGRYSPDSCEVTK